MLRPKKSLIKPDWETVPSYLLWVWNSSQPVVLLWAILRPGKCVGGGGGYQVAFFVCSPSPARFNTARRTWPAAHVNTAVANL